VLPPVRKPPSDGDIWVAFGGLGLMIANSVLTMCMCGYNGTESLLGNVAGFTFVGCAWLHDKGPRYRRITIAGCLAFASLLFIKNVSDVLWTGHEALLRRFLAG
jgi:hypothetical protein